MEAKYQEITLSEIPCSKIKKLFYFETSWDAKLADIISIKFTQLKVICRKYWPEKTEIEMLQQINKFTDQDYLDTLNL